MSTIINDIPNLQTFITNSVLFFFTNIVHLVVVLTILVIWSWKLLALCVLTFPAFAVINTVMGKQIGNLAALRLQKISEAFTLLQDQVSNLRVTRAFLNKVFENRRFTAKFDEIKNILHRHFMVGVFTQQSIGLISFLGPMIVLLYGGYNVIYGLMTVGQLIAFHTYLGQIYGPLGGLINLNLQTRGALIVYDKLDAFLTTPVEPDPPWHVEDFELGHVIAFENVYFEYAFQQPVFESLNLIIPKGVCAAIVGPSGYGKTTILNLLCRYYDPVSGDIWIDDINLKNIHPSTLRHKIGVLEQKPELFAMNVRDNILYGRLDASEEEVIEAAKRAGAHDFILELPEGYDTMVTEGGSNLSGGQRQRLAIARLILKAPPIILLDEPTVGLDVAVKEHLFHYIREMHHYHGATITVVTHELEDVDKLCNHITIIDRGRVIYSGDIEKIRERFHKRAHMIFDIHVESEWTEIQIRDLTERGLSFELEIPPEAIRVTHKEGSKIGIEVDRDAATPASVVAYMVERFGILDLQVKYATIESIIRDIYSGHVSLEGIIHSSQPDEVSLENPAEEEPNE
jgi:ABC-type multidrug transport system fused ATPase/permease subunit